LLRAGHWKLEKGNEMKKQIIVAALLSALASTSAIAQEDKSLTLDGEFGFIFTTGNTETTSGSAGLNANQELESWSNDYELTALYKQDTVDGVDSTSAQKFFASAQANYKLENPNHRLFGFASYEDDRFSNFKYQSTVAAGWNQKVWGDEKSSFEYSIGPGYSYAKNLSDETVSGMIVRGSFNYKWNISETSRFTQTFSTEVGSDNTKSRSETALSAQIAGSLSMKLSLKLDHNSDVQGNTENLDTETAVTLVYSFF